jgi:hypothetical protein
MRLEGVLATFARAWSRYAVSSAAVLSALTEASLDAASRVVDLQAIGW